jgi:hypothetical protein
MGFRLTMRKRAENVFAIFLTLAISTLGIVYSWGAISVNSGRIFDARNLESKIREQVNTIAKDPHARDIDSILRDLNDRLGRLDSVRGDIGFGMDKFWSLSFSHCILAPFDINCSHKNSSESNNLYLAMSSGALGACLFLLLGFVSQKIDGESEGAGPIVYVVCRTFGGIIVGLLVLYFLRGTKGAMLTPITEVVQVENSYGIAFSCLVAAFFSDAILSRSALLIYSAPVKDPAPTTDGILSRLALLISSAYGRYPAPTDISPDEVSGGPHRRKIRGRITSREKKMQITLLSLTLTLLPFVAAAAQEGRVEAPWHKGLAIDVEISG